MLRKIVRVDKFVYIPDHLVRGHELLDKKPNSLVSCKRYFSENTHRQRVDGTELGNSVGESRDVIFLLRPLRMVHVSVLEFFVCRHFWRIYWVEKDDPHMRSLQRSSPLTRPLYICTWPVPPSGSLHDRTRRMVALPCMSFPRSSARMCFLACNSMQYCRNGSWSTETLQGGLREIWWRS